MRRALRIITSEARLRRIPIDQTLLRRGVVPVEVYVLKEGVVKMYEADERGNEKILHLLKPPAIVPLAFFSGPAHATHWNYTAITNCDVYVLPFDALLDRLKQHSEVAVYLMNWFSLEVHELLIRLSSLERSTTHGKMLAALRFLGVYFSQPANGAWLRVIFPVSHKMLASLIGVRRESVTMALGELEEQGLVRTNEFVTLDINRKLLRMQREQRP